MARSTLARLIQEVRTLTQANVQEWTLGTASYWDDNQLEILLDRHRRDVLREPLRSHTHYVGGGSIEWRTYSSDYGQWEATDGGTAVFEVEDGLGATQGTALWTADYVRGIVTFGANQGGTAYYLTGRVFDLYGAASELLRTWAAREKLAFDFSSDGQSFKRSQKASTLLALANEYAGMGWAQTATMVRSDVGEWRR